MEIEILTTDGTIEGIDTVDNLENINSKVSISDFLDAANITLEYDIRHLFHKDSRAITDDDRELVATKIKESKSSKILITHGTFTMEATAKYLGRRDLNKTIVLVGSFTLGSSINTDAPFNLGFAICALEFLENGVYVAINGQLLDWNNVTKNLETNKFEQSDD
ncbi:asparaginase domain-containing protein [Winogradskyella maritima]|uniref:Asparaginase domain-containing protein n=1 Tax=Winogradskyella maritima TaxID=1517766 RepID=A0ABV8AFP2_9FLAO|nr:asparaginase domain-containing protein [Winogradskyella maritima]